jgi:hypothetical protein
MSTWRTWRLPIVLGMRQWSPTRSPRLRLYSLNGTLEAPTYLPWLGSRMPAWALAAELIDNVGGLAPVCVDQAAVDTHFRSVFATVRAREPLGGQLVQGGIDLPLQACARRGPADRGAHVAQREVRTALLRPCAVVHHMASEVLLPSAQHPEEHLLLHVDEHRQMIAADRNLSGPVAVELGGDLLGGQHLLADFLDDRFVLILREEGSFIAEPADSSRAGSR